MLGGAIRVNTTGAAPPALDPPVGLGLSRNRRRDAKGAGVGTSMAGRESREPQYQSGIEEADTRGVECLGLQSSESWRRDPKHLVFNLARYKFVAKMLAGSNRVLEVGCGDAFGTRIVRQEVAALTATDFDPLFIEDARSRGCEQWRFEVMTHDLAQGPVPGSFDAVYALDVLEHVPPPEEREFLRRVLAPLLPHGVAIIGMPSLESQQYASEISKKGHVNCKSMPDLKALMCEFFHNVFMFSMNDEVVHTGFHKMAHYLFAVCCGRR
jgi:2-polyprenyl-3-methyl-5-hydroxy-6-metoxy-1,4-benzoquinol methylase